MTPFSKPARGTRKTYSVLDGQGRMPSKYDVTSTGLLYYPKTGLSIRTPVVSWHEQYGPHRHIKLADWDDFADPSFQTYSDYVKVRHRSEVHLEHIVALHQESDAQCWQEDSQWASQAEAFLAPLLFPCHALQMVSGYVGSLALSGKIAICCAFQAADDMRKIYHIAERLAQIRQIQPLFANGRQELWQAAPEWQILRRLVEELLTTYDWLEAFIALNLCVKPLITSCFIQPLQEGAQKHNDQITFYKLAALKADDEWHHGWANALLKHMLQNRENVPPIEAALTRWQEKSLACSDSISKYFAEPKKPYLEALLNRWQVTKETIGYGSRSHE